MDIHGNQLADRQAKEVAIEMDIRKVIQCFGQERSHYTDKETIEKW